MDDPDMANNDVAVAPRLQKVPDKYGHRRARQRRRGGGRLRVGLPRLGRPSLPAAALATVAVLLAAASAFFGWSLHNDSDAAAQRTAIIAAANREATALTTLSKQNAASDYQAVLAGAAGDLKQQVSAGRSQLMKTLGTGGASSTGTVLDTGIVSMSSGTAKVLIDVKASVRNKHTANKPEQRVYHWQVTMVSSAGRWLMTSLEFE